jgi:alpha-N-arabinofuranosidase
VGNECWGGGGNMTPEVYAHEFRKYSAIMANSAKGLELIGCGPNGGDWRWTERFLQHFESSEHHMHGYSVHYYCSACGHATEFTDQEYYQMLVKAAGIEAIIERNWQLISGFGMQQFARLVVDEWGCWHPGGSGPSQGRNLFEQQSTMRDALVAALTLNIFNNHCDKVRMANIAQLANNLHCLFLVGGEDCITTPTYHVFDMFKDHQGGSAIRCALEDANGDATVGDPRQPATLTSLSHSASIRNDFLTLTIANLSLTESADITLEPVGFQLGRDAEISTLSHSNVRACNTFAMPDCVCPTEREGLADKLSIPPASVICLRAKVK